MLVQLFDTDETGIERDEGKHSPNETKTTKSPDEPQPEKPRSDKDHDGQDLVAKITATDKLLSKTPSTELTNDAMTWSG